MCWLALPYLSLVPGQSEALPDEQRSQLDLCRSPGIKTGERFLGFSVVEPLPHVVIVRHASSLLCEPSKDEDAAPGSAPPGVPNRPRLSSGRAPWQRPPSMRTIRPSGLCPRRKLNPETVRSREQRAPKGNLKVACLDVLYNREPARPVHCCEPLITLQPTMRFCLDRYLEFFHVPCGSVSYRS